MPSPVIRRAIFVLLGLSLAACGVRSDLVMPPNRSPTPTPTTSAAPPAQQAAPATRSERMP